MLYPKTWVLKHTELQICLSTVHVWSFGLPR